MASFKKRTNIKQERIKRKLTQREVADYVGIHITTYSNIERGLRNPSLDIALKIADFFGVDVKSLRA